MVGSSLQLLSAPRRVLEEISLEITLKCKVCDGDFVSRRRDGKTCSKECRRKYGSIRSRENKKTRGSDGLITCDCCGAKFKGRMGAKRCSKECSKKISRQRENERQRKLKPPAKARTCHNCGSTFWIKGPHKTCSKECSQEYKLKRARYRVRLAKSLEVEYRETGKGRGEDQKGEKNPHYKDGHTIYSQVGFENLPNECNRCGSLKHLLVHHRDHNRNNPALENLEILCKSCHQSHHAVRDPETGQYTNQTS